LTSYLTSGWSTSVDLDRYSKALCTYTARASTNGMLTAAKLNLLPPPPPGGYALAVKKLQIPLYCSCVCNLCELTVDRSAFEI